MSRIKAILLAGTAAALSATSTLAAADLAQTFAGCAGRMSAEMEHAWLINDPAAPDYEGQRLTFLALLDATMPRGQERTVLHHRIEAKLAHASLLTIATFSDRADRADRARTRAKWHLSACTEMLLDS